MKKFRNKLSRIIGHPSSASSASQDNKAADGMSVSDNSQHSPPPLPPPPPGPGDGGGAEGVFGAPAAAAGGAAAATAAAAGSSEAGGGGGGSVGGGGAERTADSVVKVEESSNMDVTPSLPASANKKRVPIVNNPAGVRVWPITQPWAWLVPFCLVLLCFGRVGAAEVVCYRL